AGWPRSARYRPRPRTFHSTPPFSGWKCGATWWTFIVSSSRKARLRRATFGAACGARLIAFARPIGFDSLGEGFIRAPIFAGQNFFFSSRRRHTISVSAFLLNRSSDLLQEVLYQL